MTRAPWRVLARSLALLALLPVAARAHAIHTTLTVVRQTPAGVEFIVRSFADDFSASVARFAGRAAPRDSSVRAEEVTAYLQARISVADGAGRGVRFESCGLRRQGEVYFACVRIPGLRSVRGVQLRQGTLTELHADQVNIVQVEAQGARRTLLFTRASPASALGT